MSKTNTKWMAETRLPRKDGFKDFPALLKEARLRLGETVGEFGIRLGVRGNTISRWENGLRQMPYEAIWLLLIELDMLKESLDE